MTERELFPYCCFYKGEALMPIEYAQTHAHLIWLAERFVCEEVLHQIDEADPRTDIATWVDAYVGKWAPFSYDDIMATYREAAEKLKFK